MRVVESRGEVKAWVAEQHAAGERVALVPTMGALHRGHMSLVEIGRGAPARVALSIFVNPLQFGPTEDFQRYPRDLDRDVELARAAGADLVFAPPVTEIYPDGEPWVVVVPERGADRLCGATRPGHFRGVLTVVAKLFGIFRPDLAVFGEKDYQQITLIRRMVNDLVLEVEIIGGAIVREDDGLAMSSRNRYLSTDDRGRALALSEALRACQELFASGEQEPARYIDLMQRTLTDRAVVEYTEVVDPDTLEPAEQVVHGSVCAIAAQVGKTRLIDNTILRT